MVATSIIGGRDGDPIALGIACSTSIELAAPEEGLVGFCDKVWTREPNRQRGPTCSSLPPLGQRCRRWWRLSARARRWSNVFRKRKEKGSG